MRSRSETYGLWSSLSERGERERVVFVDSTNEMLVKK